MSRGLPEGLSGDRQVRGAGGPAGEPAVAQAEEGSFDGEVEEPAAQQCDGNADPEARVGVVADAAGVQEFVCEMDELFVREVDRVGEGGYCFCDPGGIAIKHAGRAEGGEDEGAVGDGDGRIAEDGALHFVLVVVMGDEPGAGEQGEADEQDAVAVPGKLLPGPGFEIIEGGQGDADEEAVEPGPGGIIDILIIGSAEAGLSGQDIDQM